MRVWRRARRPAAGRARPRENVAALLASALGVAALAGGCGAAGGEGSRADPSVRDSAGVRIVEYPGAPAPAEALAFLPEPTWRHGAAEGDHPFQSIAAGRLQPDGGAVIADARAREVVVLGPDGSFRGVLARGGRGPAEVRGPSALHVLGQDTILVEDDGNARFALFEDGALARTIPVTDYEAARLRSLGVDATGRLLMATGAYRTDFPEPWLQGSLAWFDTGTGTVDTVASYDMAPHRDGEGPADFFGPFGEVAAAPEGWIYGRSDIPELRWIGEDGAIHQVLRWQPVRAYATEQDLVEFRERLRAELARVNPHMPSDQRAEFIESQIAKYDHVPDAPWPLFSRLQEDGVGGVWMWDVRGASFEATPGFTLVAADGTWLGHVDAPGRFRLLDVRGDEVLGVLTDDMDVQSVAVFRLERSVPAR